MGLPVVESGGAAVRGKIGVMPCQGGGKSWLGGGATGWEDCERRRGQGGEGIAVSPWRKDVGGVVLRRGGGRWQLAGAEAPPTPSMAMATREEGGNGQGWRCGFYSYCRARGPSDVRSGGSPFSYVSFAEKVLYSLNFIVPF